MDSTMMANRNFTEINSSSYAITNNGLKLWRSNKVYSVAAGTTAKTICTVSNMTLSSTSTPSFLVVRVYGTTNSDYTFRTANVMGNGTATPVVAYPSSYSSNTSNIAIPTFSFTTSSFTITAPAVTVNDGVGWYMIDVEYILHNGGFASEFTFS
jgi:hypothetical protein